VRSDSVLATHRTDAGRGTTFVSAIAGSYAPAAVPELGLFARAAFTHDEPPGGDEAANVLSHFAFGGTWLLRPAPEWRVTATLLTNVPVGMGGGDSPDPAEAAAQRAAAAARSAMDAALFLVNDWALLAGGDLAFVSGGVTLQLELNVIELVRVRGAEVQSDAAKTNSQIGVHAGWFAVPWLSLGAELRYQRWLTTPSFVSADPTGALRDNLTMTVGVRVHLQLGATIWLRPGLAYARGLDDPMAAREYHVVQLDVPLVI
jgi:hypothetical protein